MSTAPGLIKPDLKTPQQVADGLRELAVDQGDQIVASAMEVAADIIENELDLISILHRQYSDLVAAVAEDGDA